MVAGEHMLLAHHAKGILRLGTYQKWVFQIWGVVLGVCINTFAFDFPLLGPGSRLWAVSMFYNGELMQEECAFSANSVHTSRCNAQLVDAMHGMLKIDKQV